MRLRKRATTRREHGCTGMERTRAVAAQTETSFALLSVTMPSQRRRRTPAATDLSHHTHVRLAAVLVKGEGSLHPSPFTKVLHPSRATPLLEWRSGAARAPRQRVGHLDAFGAAWQRRAGMHVHLRASRELPPTGRRTASLAATLMRAARRRDGFDHRGRAPLARCAPTRAAAASPRGPPHVLAAPPCRAAAAGRPATPASCRMNPTCAPHPPTSARHDAAQHPSPPRARRRAYRAPMPPFSAATAREEPCERTPPAARP